ncbi:MAG: uncharacterized protein PWQ70_1267 [Clostridiales bacterium]|nr:uncharacterized protein [Clostridiales bacterium]
MAVMFALYPTKEVVIVGERKRNDTQQMIKVIHNTFLPHVVSILNTTGEEYEALTKMIPFIKEQKEVDVTIEQLFMYVKTLHVRHLFQIKKNL